MHVTAVRSQDKNKNRAQGTGWNEHGAAGQGSGARSTLGCSGPFGSQDKSPTGNLLGAYLSQLPLPTIPHGCRRPRSLDPPHGASTEGSPLAEAAAAAPGCWWRGRRTACRSHPCAHRRGRGQADLPTATSSACQRRRPDCHARVRKREKRHERGREIRTGMRAPREDSETQGPEPARRSRRAGRARRRARNRSSLCDS